MRFQSFASSQRPGRTLRVSCRIFCATLRRTFGLDDANGETAQPGNVFRAIARAAAVLVIVPVENVMTTVFDAPVATVGGKNVLSVG